MDVESPVASPLPAQSPPENTEHENGVRFRALIDQAKRLQPMRTAVVQPVDRNSLEGAIEAYQNGLIIPVLVGPEYKIRATADEHSIDLTGITIVDAEHSHAAAEAAVALARACRVQVLMKGALETHELLSAILNKDRGIRTERRLSHVFVLDVPTYHKLLLISDAAINIVPDLMCKADIVQNAVELARSIGINVPKVAVLAAIEKVNPKMLSTLDAAALCKMRDRDQIHGCIIDGPLAFDNAINREAAQAKGIRSEVAGDVDILLAPDLEAANMLAKQLEYLGNARSAGIVLGARVPVVLTSRAEKALGRFTSCALALLLANHQIQYQCTIPTDKKLPS